MKNRLTLVLTGGGSGGHITPLLSLAHELKRKSPGTKVIYIGLKGDKLKGLDERMSVFDETYAIRAGKFRRYHGESIIWQALDLKTWALNIRDFFRVIIGTLEARKLLKVINPDAVFSKGSYVAVPVGVAAHWQHIPIVTHDSDATAGLANKIIGKWAIKNATGMPAGDYPYPSQKIIYTGIPIDERITKVSQAEQSKLKKLLGVKPKELCLLVGGAGLGSQTINDKTVLISRSLLETFPSLQIFHITGSMHEYDIKKKYELALKESELKRVRVLGFTDKFYQYSGAADLVVSRAGATTIAELAAQAKPLLLVPAPFLTGGQQLKNAKQLEQQGAVEVLDNDVHADVLKEAIIKLLNSPNQRLSMAEKISKFARANAAGEISEIILQAAHSKE